MSRRRPDPHGRRLESVLRRHLHVAAESIEPGADGLDRIRAKISARLVAAEQAAARSRWRRAGWAGNPAWRALAPAGTWIKAASDAVIERFRPEPGRNGWLGWLRPAAALGTGIFVIAGASWAVAALPQAIRSSGSESPTPHPSVTIHRSVRPRTSPYSGVGGYPQPSGRGAAPTCSPNQGGLPSGSPSVSPTGSASSSPGTSTSPAGSPSSSPGPTDSGSTSPAPTDSGGTDATNSAANGVALGQASSMAPNAALLAASATPAAGIALAAMAAVQATTSPSPAPSGQPSQPTPQASPSVAASVSPSPAPAGSGSLPPCGSPQPPTQSLLPPGTSSPQPSSVPSS
jgi:hypothetical protein